MEERIVFDRKYESEHAKRTPVLSISFDSKNKRIVLTRYLGEVLGITKEVPFVKFMWLGDLYIAHSDDQEYGYKVVFSEGGAKRGDRYTINAVMIIRKFYEMIKYTKQTITVSVEPVSTIELDGKPAFKVNHSNILYQSKS